MDEAEACVTDAPDRPRPRVGAKTGLSSSFTSMVETGRNELTVGRFVMLADFSEGPGFSSPTMKRQQR
jgi:hypothetical protein